uniref:Uncharacterized protein n=1 Tax=uncultured Desulfobacterium sp. TaxID=201089 RepID=E1YL72_9BACT|nr:unknown protein [uncultured Desulfobacterium sp.]
MPFISLCIRSNQAVLPINKIYSSIWTHLCALSQNPGLFVGTVKIVAGGILNYKF